MGAPSSALKVDSHTFGRRRCTFEDEESTEAPSSGASCCSEAEGSGTEGGSGSCADDESYFVAAGLQPNSPALQPGHKRRQQPGQARLRAVVRRQRRIRGAAFNATPLSPIPGTPVGMTEHPPLLLLPAATLCGDSETEGCMAIPASPTLKSRLPRADDASFSFPHCSTPLKVALPCEGLSVRRKALHPALPAKKRPIMPEMLQGVAFQRLLQQLDPGMPVKKRVTPWITSEPGRVLPAPPR